MKTHSKEEGRPRPNKKLGARAPLLLGCALLAAWPAQAAPKKRKGPAYPGIIQMTPPSGSSPASDGKLVSSEISGLDLRFLRSAHEAGQWQTYLCDMAHSRGQSDAVRKLGGALAAEQSAEIEQLGKLSARKGAPVATDADALRRRLADELGPLEGLKFDKAVLDQFLAANRLAVSAYEAGANSQDADIRAFVAQMLPVAKARLQLAGKMAGAPTQPSGVPRFRNTAPPTTR